MSVPATKRVRGEQTRSNADAATHSKSADASEEKGAGTLQNDRVLVLNIGGTNITTLESTLCSSPSLLAEWAKNDFRQFPRDLQGHPFIDRDPYIFAHIVNYLRGYGLPSKTDDLVVVAEDAELYQLEALKREIGLNPPSMWRFTPGPGVREDGVEFSTSDILDICGTEPLSTSLVHTITFRMDKCELISVGMVAFKDVQLDMQIRRQKNSVCYCNTGEFVRYWSTDALYDQGVLYKSQDEITVRVEFAQPGVPLEPSAGTQLERALPPPLQPALRLAAPLPSSVATVNSLGTIVAARLPAPATAAPSSTPATAARTTVTIHTGGGLELNTTASALQPGSPLGDATTNSRAPQGIRGTPVPGSIAATAATNSNTDSANANSATTATATPAVAQPMGIPSTAPTAAPAASQGAAAVPPSSSLPLTPIVLDPEDPDASIGAIVFFYKGDKEVCRARWPAPVPPLQFAVSMQGASAVSIVRASSVSPDAVNMESEK
ncbi:hypothetical protein ABB37_01768 [Leptomonas pyrrhocoris]|uniref:BTB domain-containing protein n=1 Tax=Leptomonas pyrrhocoris TaxID=157538 RepID=A0A0M9G9G9_LEPPY|nr:hypothetical protein ABB37_01768 [Leptomonas pyrrhocoris]XP_015663916.1 hypothetical protein ABB37_01768 [Leptomonas pyrrhocoris]KPA85476.1 hypothetical protein ABB37_01768 [Leptomonas pyrrhocoris]KPA85477.1 hypothetical protein ABB37_01768 [Leptomonas pyrrhocoris]|eukprot:XP_015663915.1 hypothetical protein ABB37_01768 [Leptomonas pyrrhocoris]